MPINREGSERLRQSANLESVSVEQAGADSHAATRALLMLLRNQGHDPSSATEILRQLGEKGLVLEKRRRQQSPPELPAWREFAAALAREVLKRRMFNQAYLSQEEQKTAVYFAGNTLVNGARAALTDLAREPALMRNPGFARLSETDRVAVVTEWMDQHGIDTQYPLSTLNQAMATVLKISAFGKKTVTPYASPADLHRAFIALVHDWQHANGSLVDPRVLLGLNLAKANDIVLIGATPQQRLADLRSYVNDLLTVADGPPRFDARAALLDILMNDSGLPETEFTRPLAVTGRSIFDTLFLDHATPSVRQDTPITFSNGAPLAVDSVAVQLSAAQAAFLTEDRHDSRYFMAQARLSLRQTGAPLTDETVQANAQKLIQQDGVSRAEPPVAGGLLHWLENTPILSNILGFVDGVMTGSVEEIFNSVPVVSNIYNIEEGLRTGDVKRAGMGAITLVPFAGSAATIVAGAVNRDAAEAVGGVEGLALDFVTLGEGHLLLKRKGRIMVGHALEEGAVTRAHVLPVEAFHPILRVHAEQSLTALQDLGFDHHDWAIRITPETTPVQRTPQPKLPAAASPDAAWLSRQLDGYAVTSRPTLLQTGVSGMLWDAATVTHYAEFEGQLYRVAPDRAKTSPQRPIWNVVSADGSRTKINIRIEFVGGHWQVARDLPGLSGGAPGRKKPPLPQLDLSRLDKTERLHRLAQVSNRSTHFHGSRSGSLIAFHPSMDPALRGALLPMGTLLERSVPVYSGERGSSLYENAFNRSHLSVVSEENYEEAVNYATNPALASRTPIQMTPPTLPSGFTSYGQNAQYLSQAATAKLHELGADSTIGRFINANFPVVYGLKPNAGQLVRVSSSIAGEYGVRGGCGHSQIAVVFVPDEYVEAVKTYLDECGYPKEVKPLSSLPA